MGVLPISCGFKNHRTF